MLSISTVARFAKSLSGEVVLPQERRYGALRKVKNRAVNKRPAIIVRCADRKDVQLAVDFARHNGLLTAVRSGGHSFAGYGVCDGGLVIDLSAMKRVQINPAHETIRIEPGIIAGELDCLTHSFRMAVPLGSCPSVGVAGYSLGGGESSLTPKFGYGCDSIVGLEVVTAEGKIMTVKSEENSDLFWAMRGAGANFGIATSLEFKLHPIETVLSGSLRYPIRQARKSCSFSTATHLRFPPNCFLSQLSCPIQVSGCLTSKLFGWAIRRKGKECYDRFASTCGRSKILLSPRLISMSSAAASTCRKASTRVIDAPATSRSSLKTLSMTIIEHLPSAPHEASGITMMYWHGPWCAKPHDNAFGFRRTGFEYWIHSYWQKAGDREQSWNWVEEFYRAMEPLSTGAVYVNDLEDEGDCSSTRRLWRQVSTPVADQAQVRPRQLFSRQPKHSSRHLTFSETIAQIGASQPRRSHPDSRSHLFYRTPPW